VLRELLPQVVQPSCALESLVGGEDDSDLEMEVGAAETASEADDDTDAVDDDSDGNDNAMIAMMILMQLMMILMQLMMIAMIAEEGEETEEIGGKKREEDSNNPAERQTRSIKSAHLRHVEQQQVLRLAPLRDPGNSCWADLHGAAHAFSSARNPFVKRGNPLRFFGSGKLRGQRSLKKGKDPRANEGGRRLYNCFGKGPEKLGYFKRYPFRHTKHAAALEDPVCCCTDAETSVVEVYQQDEKSVVGVRLCSASDSAQLAATSSEAQPQLLRKKSITDLFLRRRCASWVAQAAVGRWVASGARTVEQEDLAASVLPSIPLGAPVVFHPGFTSLSVMHSCSADANVAIENSIFLPGPGLVQGLEPTLLEEIDCEAVGVSAAFLPGRGRVRLSCPHRRCCNHKQIHARQRRIRFEKFQAGLGRLAKRLRCFAHRSLHRVVCRARVPSARLARRRAAAAWVHIWQKRTGRFSVCFRRRAIRAYRARRACVKEAVKGLPHHEQSVHTWHRQDQLFRSHLPSQTRHGSMSAHNQIRRRPTRYARSSLRQERGRRRRIRRRSKLELLETGGSAATLDLRPITCCYCGDLIHGLPCCSADEPCNLFHTPYHFGCFQEHLAGHRWQAWEADGAATSGLESCEGGRPLSSERATKSLYKQLTDHVDLLANLEASTRSELFLHESRAASQPRHLVMTPDLPADTWDASRSAACTVSSSSVQRQPGGISHCFLIKDFSLKGGP
jgi:hypothetical protein